MAAQKHGPHITGQARANFYFIISYSVACDDCGDSINIGEKWWRVLEARGTHFIYHGTAAGLCEGGVTCGGIAVDEQ
jgi:hypothetical protein